MCHAYVHETKACFVDICSFESGTGGARHEIKLPKHIGVYNTLEYKCHSPSPVHESQGWRTDSYESLALNELLNAYTQCSRKLSTQRKELRLNITTYVTPPAKCLTLKSKNGQRMPSPGSTWLSNSNKRWQQTAWWIAVQYCQDMSRHKCTMLHTNECRIDS